MRRTVFNFGDPLLFVNVSIPFSAALLGFSCDQGLISWDKLELFFLVLLSFLAGGRVATAFFGRDEFRTAIIRSVDRLGRTEIYIILSLTTLITVVLSLFALRAGAQGDARQDFSRAFRPLVTLQSGLWLFSLLALLSRKLSKKTVAIWFVLLVVPSVAFSGKSVLLPVFFWFGLSYFINQKHAGVAAIATLTGGVFLGVAVMGLIAYGASSSVDVLYLIIGRLWLSGDVYIYAYQDDALAMVRGDYHTSFISYMLHPLTSLVGIRGYEKPLGSMLASEVLRSDVLVGPNPHLPVLLDYFFPGEFVVTVALSIVIGALIISVRVAGIRMAQSRSRYLALGGIAAAIFCPSAGFTDTSQVLILLIGIASITSVCCLLEMLAAPQRLRNPIPCTPRPGLRDSE